VPRRYSFAELRAAGCSASELRAARCSAASLRGVGFPLAALVAAGYSAAELLQASFAPLQLRAAHVAQDDIVAALPAACCLQHGGFCYRYPATCQCCATSRDCCPGRCRTGGRR
jgi:uncharacterized protein YjbI with pentapeptide repeats